jgi:CrcB protein
MSTVLKLMLIAGGGALGALLRYGVSGAALRLLGADFPWGTLCANLTGCFLIGLLWVLAERVAFHPYVNPFVFTGLLGAFTTFSTYSLESIALLRDGEVWRGVLNIALSNGLGLAAVIAGFACAHLVIGSSH